MKQTTKTLNQLAKEFLSVKSALIFCHIRPDGDTLGSAFALALAMKQRGIETDVVCDGDIPEKYSFNKTFCFLKPENVLKKYEIHIAVDVAGEHLLGRGWGIYVSAEKRYCIDHHPSNSRFATDLYLEYAPSTTLIIHRLINEMGVEINKEIAECLLIGIITDTGNFMHNSTNEECFAVAGKMLSLGANFQNIINNVFKNQSKARSTLYASVMSKMRYCLDDKLAIITVRNKDLLDLSLKEDETEGFVDYPLTVRGVEVAVSLLESKKDLYRVSFRSKGKVDVNAVAQEFGGGGHKFASGCVIHGLYEEVLEKIIRAVDINIY